MTINVTVIREAKYNTFRNIEKSLNEIGWCPYYTHHFSERVGTRIANQLKTFGALQTAANVVKNSIKTYSGKKVAIVNSPDIFIVDVNTDRKQVTFVTYINNVKHFENKLSVDHIIVVK